MSIRGPGSAGAVRRLLWKDALAESRGFERMFTLGVFAVAVLLTFHFSVPVTSDARGIAGAGFLWAALVFACLLELRRTFADERADGTLDALRAAPVEPVAIFAAKLISNLVVVGALSAGLAVLTGGLFTEDLSGVPAAFGVLVLGAVGLLAWGTLFAALAAGVRSGELVLGILLFPLVVPQTIAGVRLVGHYLGAAPLDDPLTGFVLMAAFDVLSLGTAILLFDYALEE